MTNKTVASPPRRFQLNAIVAGGVAFIAVYVVGIIAIVLVSTMANQWSGYDALMLSLRLGGWLALAFPAWVAARVANRNAWSYGVLFGILQGAAVIVLMTLSFSWEGTFRAQILSSMLPAFGLVMASTMLGSSIARWQNRRRQAVEPPQVTV